VLCFLPVIPLPLHFSRRMIAALRLSQRPHRRYQRRASKIRSLDTVVKSFTNEAFENTRFNYENDRFLRAGMWLPERSMVLGRDGRFHAVITIAVIVFAQAARASALDLADL